MKRRLSAESDTDAAADRIVTRAGDGVPPDGAPPSRPWPRRPGHVVDDFLLDRC